MSDLLPAPASAPLPQADAARNAALLQKQKNVAGVKNAAKNFEAMYMREMLSYMWEGVETDGPFGGGKGEEVFRSMMIDEYGKIIADSGQTKIADHLTREILRMQEQQQNPRGNFIRNPGESDE